jgi:hypothetical protein
LSQKEAKYSHVLLELLKVFPEELQNRSLRIGDNRRNAVQQELATQTESVLTFLVCKCGVCRIILNLGVHLPREFEQRSIKSNLDLWLLDFQQTMPE